MVPPQLTSRLGFINPGLTLLKMIIEIVDLPNYKMVVVHSYVSFIENRLNP